MWIFWLVNERSIAGSMTNELRRVLATRNARLFPTGAQLNASPQ